LGRQCGESDRGSAEFVIAQYDIENAAEAFRASDDPHHVKVLVTIGSEHQPTGDPSQADER
jgi:hypothetical protein